MSERSVLIRFDTDTTSLEQAKQKIEAIENQTARVKCEVDVDGKVIQTNIQEALKRVQDGKINQLKLNLDLSTLTKQLKQAESLASKTATEIKEDFEKSTKSRTAETLRKNYIGKKSFKGKSSDAADEIMKYYNSALDNTKSLEFDIDSPDLNIDQIYNYSKSLRELLTVMQDISSVANAKGINLSIDMEEELSRTENALRNINDKSVDLIQNISKLKSTSLPPIIENLKSQFMELPDVLSGGIPKVVDNQIATLQEDLSLAKQEAQNLSDAISELEGRLDASDSYGKDMADQLGTVKDEIEEYRKQIDLLQNELSSMQQLKVSGSSIDTGAPEEANQLMGLASTLDIVIKKVNEKTAAFRTEAATVNGVVDNEVAALNKVLSIVEKIAGSVGKLPTSIKGAGFKNIAKDLDSLSKIDLSKLQPLNGLDLSGLSDVKVNSRSFTNLVNGLKELSSINLSQLKNLQGINFEGLGNLKYFGKAVDVLTKQSKQFLDTQNKQIDSDLKRYRGAGLSEEDLRPLKEAKELLNSSFTASGMLDMSDVTGEMSAFVSMLSEAENKCDDIAASLKAASDATATAEASVSKYSTLLNKEKTLLNKRLKNGSWTPMEKYDYDRILAERREIERKYANDEKFQETQLPYRKAVYKTAKKEYSDFLEDVYNKAKDVVDKEPDIINTDNLDKVKTAFNRISELKDKFANNDFLSDKDIKEARELSNSIDDISKSLQYKTTSKGSYIGSLGDVNNIEEAIEKTRELIRVRAEEKKSKINFVDLSHDGATKGAITYDEITNDGTIKRQVANLNLLEGSIRNTTKSEQEYISQGQKFINSIKGKFAELTRYIGVMDVVQSVLGFVRKGISSIIDINTAMTELKKVTDETTETYANFQETAGKTAVTVGSTTKDLISSTADFARLGYSLEESSELAKNTAIYKNVGDGIDINTATEDIVSITKAYGIAAEESMHIIDVLNEVGKLLPRCFSNIASKLITISVKVMGMIRPRKDIMFSITEKVIFN